MGEVSRSHGMRVVLNSVIQVGEQDMTRSCGLYQVSDVIFNKVDKGIHEPLRDMLYIGIRRGILRTVKQRLQ